MKTLKNIPSIATGASIFEVWDDDALTIRIEVSYAYLVVGYPRIEDDVIDQMIKRIEAISVPE